MSIRILHKSLAKMSLIIAIIWCWGLCTAMLAHILGWLESGIGKETCILDYFVIVAAWLRVKKLAKLLSKHSCCIYGKENAIYSFGNLYLKYICYFGVCTRFFLHISSSFLFTGIDSIFIVANLTSRFIACVLRFLSLFLSANFFFWFMHGRMTFLV